MIRTALIAMSFSALGTALALAAAWRFGLLSPQIAYVDLNALIDEQARALARARVTGEASRRDAADASRRVEQALEAARTERDIDYVLIAPALASPGRLHDLTPRVRALLQGGNTQ